MRLGRNLYINQGLSSKIGYRVGYICPHKIGFCLRILSSLQSRSLWEERFQGALQKEGSLRENSAGCKMWTVDVAAIRNTGGRPPATGSLTDQWWAAASEFTVHHSSFSLFLRDVSWPTANLGCGTKADIFLGDIGLICWLDFSLVSPTALPEFS